LQAPIMDLRRPLRIFQGVFAPDSGRVMLSISSDSGL
jgi:hypothetical protein